MRFGEKEKGYSEFCVRFVKLGTAFDVWVCDPPEEGDERGDCEC